MDKPTPQTTYLFHGNRVEALPYFLYEVSIYQFDNGWIGCAASKFYKSSKLLNIKKDVIVKKIGKIKFIKYITLLGVPIEFIKENNLQIYEINKKSSKKKKKK